MRCTTAGSFVDGRLQGSIQYEVVEFGWITDLLLAYEKGTEFVKSVLNKRRKMLLSATEIEKA